MSPKEKSLQKSLAEFNINLLGVMKVLIAHHPNYDAEEIAEVLADGDSVFTQKQAKDLVDYYTLNAGCLEQRRVDNMLKLKALVMDKIKITFSDEELDILKELGLNV